MNDRETLVERALDECLDLINSAAPDAFANGNTDESGQIDEGNVRAAGVIQRARAALAVVEAEQGTPSAQHALEELMIAVSVSAHANRGGGKLWDTAKAVRNAEAAARQYAAAINGEAQGARDEALREAAREAEEILEALGGQSSPHRIMAGRDDALRVLRAALASAAAMGARDEALRMALEECIEALRLTREYVGEGLLPALPGWQWFDATNRARAALASAAASTQEVN